MDGGFRGYGPNARQVSGYLQRLRRLDAASRERLAAAEKQTTPDAWLALTVEVHRWTGRRARAMLRCADRAGRRARALAGEQPGCWLASLGASSLAMRPYADAATFRAAYGGMDELIPLALLGEPQAVELPATPYAVESRAVRVSLSASVCVSRRR